MTKSITLIKCHGGKKFLAPWIISLFPQNYEQLNYGEFFFGGGAVFFSKKPSIKEHINDIDIGLYSLWQQIKIDPESLINRLKTISYTESVFKQFINQNSAYPLDIATKEFVLRRMSRGGLKKHFAFTERLRGGIAGDINAWLNSIDKIDTIIHQRLRNTEITCLDACIWVDYYNSEDWLLYLDPPYLHETRVSKNAYEHEMTKEQHIDLAWSCNNSSAKILISGYDSELYRELYKNWNRYEKEIANHSSQAKIKKKKLEILYTNF